MDKIACGMITEDYVSFETAKLLKEKGFDEYCKSAYHVGSVCSVASLGYHDNEGHGALIEEKQNSDFGKYDNAISAPTLQMTMKWLRDEKHYYIQVMLDGWACGDHSGYYVVIQKTDSDFEMMLQDAVNEVFYQTYEEACEAAIKYCLENLI